MLLMKPRTVNLMNNILTWFANAWLALAVSVNVAAIVGVFANSSSFWSGVGWLQSIYNPFNVTNLVTQIALFAPVAGAIYWRERRQERPTD